MSREKVLRRTEEFSSAVNDMHKMHEQPGEAQVELKAQITDAQKKDPNVLYLEPVHRVRTGVQKDPKMEEKNGYLREYVTGVYENMIITGEPQDLWYNPPELPGEDYCCWKIPANRPIAIPRFLAQHLSKNLRWKEPKPLAVNQDPTVVHQHEIDKPLSIQTITKKRGTFSPLNAY